MEYQRLQCIANELSSLNFRWQLMGDRLAKRMEEMMAVFATKLQPSCAEDPSCLEVTRAEEQPTKETPTITITLRKPTRTTTHKSHPTTPITP
jgi:hypothetical protein